MRKRVLARRFLMQAASFHILQSPYQHRKHGEKNIYNIIGIFQKTIKGW